MKTAQTALPGDLFDGQVALVTGAGQGNGAAIARGLARCGAQVIVADINEGNARTVATDIKQAGGSAWVMAFDVTDEDAVQSAAAQCDDQFGPVSIVINNAGIIERMPVDDERLLDSAQRLWQVNVQGTLIVTRAFLPQLRATRGRVVNLGSIASFVAYPNVTGYAASKGAVAQVTRALAIELAADGIRVNAIAPGVINTPMTRETREDPVRINAFLAGTPMGRVGEPEEMIGPVVFLASEMSSYVTGAVVPVDGGYLCR